MKLEILLVASAFLGWIIGSAINYLADVLPLYRRMVISACPNCQTRLGLSWYLFHRPCSGCGRKISLRERALQMVGFLGFLLIATIFAESPSTIVQAWLVFSFFVIVIVIDIEHHLILHMVTLSGAIMLGIIGFVKHGWLYTLLGGAAGFVFMYILYLLGVWFGKFLSKRRGTPVEEGLGFGDVTLGTVCGLLLGWPGVSVGLFGGILLGGLYSLVLIVISLLKRDYKPYRTIPYGPFLAIAVFAIWVFRLP